ncbi:MAG TPA: UDP-N-acetylglucosamine--N-acetylmuramyl-(pentapeptide) pyrophosphoryl-undecaprenol N-acetylglucosamine transferase [Longilinea sp.]|nr:UDP-N-acetylglucosamine--N-acetylmuramyl-(pentapeptide) pyrophosphoryl-undecaprenol N-acetylglucosamine transferase [Longilinea sp.]
MYPALAVLPSLAEAGVQVLWVGGEGGMEADLVQRTHVPYTAIPAAGLHGVGLRALPGNMMRVFKGISAARRILKEFQPDVLFYTGGYVAGPMAVAGWKIPTLLYVPDIEPGLALKGLSKFSRCIALTAEPSRKFFANRRQVITGYPTRPELKGWDRVTGRKTLGLKKDGPVLLVFGGSKGARTINRAVLASVSEILETAQVIHITGQLDWQEVEAARNTLSESHKERYHIYPYLHEEMGAAYASADLVVSRAGASCLGDFPLFGLPAILVPYPYAWRYQKVNAGYLVEKGAALLLEDEKMSTQLFTTIRSLLADPQRLETMRTQMRRLAVPDAADRIAALILELGNEKKEVNQ